MNNRRIRKLPQRDGKRPDADAISGGSLDIVDLASRHRSEEDRKEVNEQARADRLQALREARKNAPVTGGGGTEAEEANDQSHEETPAFEAFQVDQPERRVFSTPVQQKIATLNTSRIRWFERGGRLAAVGTVLISVVLLFAYVAQTDRNVEDDTANQDPSSKSDPSLDYASYLSNAKRVARKFVLAESPGERLKYVRYPEKVAGLMLKDKSMDWNAPLPFGEIKTYDLPFLDHPFFLGCYVEDGNQKKYPIEVEISSDGFLVDWEAFAEYNEVPWEVLMEERSTRRDYSLRVVASLDDYYNYQFTEDNYTCFHIQNRARTVSMYAYAPKKGWVESEIRKFLSATINTQGARSALTSLIQIKIRFPEQKTPRPMVEITTYLAPHWFTLPPDEDERSMVNPRALLGAGSEDEIPLIHTNDGSARPRRAPEGSWR